MSEKKVVFCFRDDDYCGFTNPEIFEKVYRKYLGKVTISVVPNSFSYHKNIAPFKEKRKKYELLSNNLAGVDFLKKGIKLNRFEIALHGYNHEYKLLNNKWRTELEYKDQNEIQHEISEGKKYLEECLECNINLFVPPNNVLNKKTTKILVQNRLDSSSTIKHLYDRPFSLKTFKNYITRWIYWIKFKVHYGGVMKYKNFNEIFAHRLPSTFEKFLRLYKFSLNREIPLVLFTHYWQIDQNNKKREVFNQIVDFVNKNCEFKTISEIIKDAYE